MKAFFSRFSRRTFWCYALVITLLGAYAWQLKVGKTQRTERYQSCQESQEIALKTLWRDLTVKGDALSRDFYNSPNVERQRLLEQSIQIRRFCEEQVGSIEEVLNNIVASGNTGQAEALVHRMQTIGDSLRLFAQNNSQAIFAINQVYSTACLVTFLQVLKKGAHFEKAIELSGMRLSLVRVSITLLQEMETRLAADYGWKINSYMPVISTKNGNARVGEAFSGELFALKYTTQPDGMEVQVNGKRIPVVDGLGKFKTVYSEAGMKKMHTVIKVTDSRTGAINTYSKDVILEVSQ
jgi:hypothetical protein